MGRAPTPFFPSTMPAPGNTENSESVYLEGLAHIINEVSSPTKIGLMHEEEVGESLPFTVRTEVSGVRYLLPDISLAYDPITPVDADGLHQALTADHSFFPPSISETIARNQMGYTTDLRGWRLISVIVDHATAGDDGGWQPDGTGTIVPVSLAFEVPVPSCSVLQRIERFSRATVASMATMTTGPVIKSWNTRIL